MSIIQYEPVHIGDFSSFIENLVSKTKSKRFINVKVKLGLLKEKIIF